MDKQTEALLQGYVEKSKGKLQVAQKLLKGGDLDDAVSRAYYCVFHAAQAVLLTEGLSAETHQGLVNLFGLHLVKTGKFEKRFGKYLANLKDDRESGDYEVYSVIDRETAEQAVREAGEFLQATETYLKGFLRAGSGPKQSPVS